MFFWTFSHGHHPEVYESFLILEQIPHAAAYQIKTDTIEIPTAKHAPNALTVTWASAKKNVDIDPIPDCTL